VSTLYFVCVRVQFNLLEQSVRLRNDIAEMKRNLYKVGNFDEVPVAVVGWRVACQSAGTRLVAQQRHQKAPLPPNAFAAPSRLSSAANDFDRQPRSVDVTAGIDLRPRRDGRERRRLPMTDCRGDLADEDKENSRLVAAAAAAARTVQLFRQDDALFRLKNTKSPEMVAVTRCRATFVSRFPPLTHVPRHRCEMAKGLFDADCTLPPPCGKRATSAVQRTRKLKMNAEIDDEPASTTTSKTGSMTPSRRETSTAAEVTCHSKPISVHSDARANMATAISYSTYHSNDDTSVWSGTGSRMAWFNDRRTSMTETPVNELSTKADPDLSRIVPRSPDHMRCREQTSSGDLTGAFHSTFVYPLHSTMMSVVTEDPSTYCEDVLSEQPERQNDRRPGKATCSITASSLSPFSVRSLPGDDSSSADSAMIAGSKTKDAQKMCVEDDDIFIDVGVRRGVDTSPIGDVTIAERDYGHSEMSDEFRRPSYAIPVQSMCYFPPLTVTTTPSDVVKETGGSAWCQQPVPPSSFSSAVDGRFDDDSSSSTSSSQGRLFMKRQLAQTRFENDDDITVDVVSIGESLAQSAGNVSPFPPSATTTASAAPANLVVSDTSTRAVEGSTIHVDRWPSSTSTFGHVCRHHRCRAPRYDVTKTVDQSRQSVERVRPRQVPVEQGTRDLIVRTDRKCNDVSARCHRHRRRRVVVKHR